LFNRIESGEPVPFWMRKRHHQAMTLPGRSREGGFCWKGSRINSPSMVDRQDVMMCVNVEGKQ